METKSAAQTLKTLLDASQSPTHPFWESVLGGVTTARMQAMLDLYNNIPLQIYNLANHTDLQGQQPTYLELGTNLVSPAKRLLDLQVHNPSVDEHGAISMHIRTLGLMKRIGTANHLIKIGGNTESGTTWLNFKPVINQIVFRKEDVEAGSISQKDYDAMIEYCAFWAKKEAEFEALKAENKDLKATSWIYLASPNGQKKSKGIISIVPANDQFRFVVEPTISVYNPAENPEIFTPALNYIPITIANFTLLGSGLSSYKPTYITPGFNNPPVSAVKLQEPVAPAQTLPSLPTITTQAVTAPVAAAAPELDPKVAALLADPKALANFLAAQTASQPTGVI